MAVRADVAGLHYLVPPDAAGVRTLYVSVFGNVKEFGVKVLMFDLPIRLASVA